ncbi:preprotein translocase subunit SecA [Patescibacteria group bacterium]|nr:preprotein translocase subunit SecA [Patescibacteria group bacterium]MBU1890390.1 preprotein translocase subunit SecA [Patescibacteria group bacterium]
MSIFSKLFGDANQSIINGLQKEVELVNALESDIKKLSDEGLKKKTDEFKQRLKDGKTLDDILHEAFAVVREAAKRQVAMRHFDAQILGGLVLHQGKITEMRTGEGKTLVATLPLYLNALEGKGAHLVTVNDYLARRDAVWMSPVYYNLGLSVGCIQHDTAYVYDPEFDAEEEQLKYLRPVSRAEAYQADIVYGTNNEFGFDYLRDNMVPSLERKVQRQLNYAIVDEVDSILIDEARTPLIISAPAEESADLYYKFARLIPRLKENEDFNIDEKMKSATLTEGGIEKMEQWLGVGNIYVEGGIEQIHHIEQALKAYTLFKLDRDYVVKEGEVIIVDEFTGRMMPGRRYSEGLHQAIEAKENVKIRQESRTMATITFQNFFRMYDKLSGMTGTAATEAEEFSKIYNLDVIIIPTHKPMVRKDNGDLIYKSVEAKYKAVVQDIKRQHETGRPVLVGTISIERNELLSQLLEREGVPYQMLNAKQHAKEADIITQAGRVGGVTIATNMAGRGVDIKLGGDPYNEAEAKKVIELGGLYVIGTERHESRRIDNQLRGRSGRQGDPGESRFFVSLEDDLMRIFGSDKIKSIMERLGVPDDMPIENKMISKSIESAQKKVEGYNFDVRKRLVEYDDVINKHREVVYKKRNEILQAAKHEGQLREKILEMVNNEIEQVILFHTADESGKSWNIKEIGEVLKTMFPTDIDASKRLNEIMSEAKDKLQVAQLRTELINYCFDLANTAYDKITEQINNPEMISQIEKSIVLRSIDVLWMEHLEHIDYLRRGIGLRGYGQRDPLVEYKKEAYEMFSQLVGSIQSQVVYSIFKVGQAKEMTPDQMQQGQIIESGPTKTMLEGRGQFQQIQPAEPKQDGKKEDPEETVTKPGPVDGTVIKGGKIRMKDGAKIGRNDPCPCGSGKKFKKCHGK